MIDVMCSKCGDVVPVCNADSIGADAVCYHCKHEEQITVGQVLTASLQEEEAVREFLSKLLPKLTVVRGKINLDPERLLAIASTALLFCTEGAEAQGAEIAPFLDDLHAEAVRLSAEYKLCNNR